MFLHELRENESMKSSIRSLALKGVPIYAECGGLMYLCKNIQGFADEVYDMVGIVPAVCKMQKKLQRVGYVKGTALSSSIIAEKGDELKGHEFHFSTMEDEGNFSWAYSLQGTRQKTSHIEGYSHGNILASYLHLSFDGNPKAADHFIESCKKYRDSRR